MKLFAHKYSGKYGAWCDFDFEVTIIHKSNDSQIIHKIMKKLFLSIHKIDIDTGSLIIAESTTMLDYYIKGLNYRRKHYDYM